MHAVKVINKTRTEKWKTRSAWIGQQFVDKLEGAFGTRLYLPGGGLARKRELVFNWFVKKKLLHVAVVAYLIVVVSITEFERLDEVIVGKG